MKIRSFLMRRSQRKYKFEPAIMGNRKVAIGIVDRHGTFTLVNPVLEKLLGWEEADLLGKDLHGIIHRCANPDAPQDCPLYRTVLLKELFQRHDDVLRRRDGTTVPVTYVSSPVILNGRVAGTVFMIEDTTKSLQELAELRENEERYRYLAEASPEPMWLTDSFGYVTVANNSAAELFGYAGWAQMAQLNALELFELKDRPRAVQAKNNAAKEGASSTGTFTMRAKADPGGGQKFIDRNSFPAEIRVSPVRDAAGNLKAVLYAARDLTRQPAQLEQPKSGPTPMSLEQAVAVTLSTSSLLGDTIPRILQTVCEHGSWDVGMYWQLDTDDQVLRCSALWHVTDLSPSGLESLSHQWSFAPGVDLPGNTWSRNEPTWVRDVVTDTSMLRALMASKEGLHGALCFPISAGGGLQGVMEFFSRDVREPDPVMMRASDSVSAQIGWFLERHQAEKELRHKSLHDPLTGLPNRSLLLDRLRRALFVSRETGKPVALFMLDLDNFKEVNDTHGQDCGDELLRQVARRLNSALRDADTVARLDGDEFAVMLPGTDEAGAVVVAEKIVESMNEPFTAEDVHIQTGASIGISLYPKHGDDVAELMRAADAAMYVAKRGRSGYAVHTADERISGAASYKS